MKSKTQTIEVTGKKKLLFILVFIGVLSVIGDGAPYIHMTFDKKPIEWVALDAGYDNGTIDKETYKTKKAIIKAKYETFGFSTARRFLFAIGVAIAVFCVATLFFLSLVLPKNDLLQKAFTFSALSFLLNGVYYIIWVFWENPDLPVWLYQLIILVLAILCSISLFYLYKKLASNNSNIQILQGNLDTLDRDLKVIKELGQMMPENENYLTYKVMIDVTSEDLTKTKKKIESQLTD